jgi:hypothetical protein
LNERVNCRRCSMGKSVTGCRHCVEAGGDSERGCKH